MLRAVNVERVSPLAFPALFTLAFACGGGGETNDGIDASVRDGGVALGHDGGSERDGGAARDGGTERDGGVGDGVCPPTDVTGTAVGSIMPDLALPDCAGNLHNFQDPCPRKAAYYFVYAEW